MAIRSGFSPQATPHILCCLSHKMKRIHFGHGVFTTPISMIQPGTKCYFTVRNCPTVREYVPECQQWFRCRRSVWRFKSLKTVDKRSKRLHRLHRVWVATPNAACETGENSALGCDCPVPTVKQRCALAQMRTFSHCTGSLSGFCYLKLHTSALKLLELRLYAWQTNVFVFVYKYSLKLSVYKIRLWAWAFNVSNMGYRLGETYL